MPTMTASEATERIIQAVERMDTYDLADFYHEVFPAEPKPDLTHPAAPDVEVRKILDYIKQGLATEEILDIWRVAFPGVGPIEFDDETLDFHYSESPEAIKFLD